MKDSKDVVFLFMGIAFAAIAISLATGLFSRNPASRSRWGRRGQGPPMSWISQFLWTFALVLFAFTALGAAFHHDQLDRISAPVFGCIFFLLL